MATRDQPPPVAAAGDERPAAAGPGDSTEQALARSREIRQKGNRQIQALRIGPGAGSGPVAQQPAARVLDVGEEIERSRQARARLAELAAKLVQTEETVAHIHDEMASRDSGRAAEYRRAADDARQAACRAREIERNAAQPTPVQPGPGWHS